LLGIATADIGVQALERKSLTCKPHAMVGEIYTSRIRAVPRPIDEVASRANTDLENLLPATLFESREVVNVWLPFVTLTLQLREELSPIFDRQVTGAAWLRFPMGANRPL